MAAYYNEIDPYAAQWLRNLIAAGHIAPGDVDERSILDVRAGDLAGYAQCHFFAGIGVWSHALRSAGWADDRPVWTGSCPCQPFSAAGKGEEFDDDRHLWPAWFRLIRECRPVAVFGEQVASRDALAWLDHVCADLEGEGYAVGAVDTCAAGFGAPHIRQRLYFVADANGAERGLGQLGLLAQGRARDGAAGSCERAIGAMADDDERGREILGAPRLHDYGQPGHDADRRGEPDGMADASGGRFDEQRRRAGGEEGTRQRRGESDDSSIVGDAESDGREEPHAQGATRGNGSARQRSSPGPTNGFWRNAEWLPCRDGKARPTQPGTFPLVDGAPSRVGRLRAYGNCICAPQAAEFIRAYGITMGYGK